MSTESAQERAAQSNAAWQMELAQRMGFPAIQESKRLLGAQGLGGMLDSRDASGMMAMDRGAYGSALGDLKSAYGRAGNVNREAINYEALRGGVGRTDPGAVSSAISGAATGLARDQAAAERNLQFLSAQSSLNNYNKVMSLFGQGTNQALSMGSGFGSASNAAISGMNPSSQFGSILGGATAGASLGTTINPGWGTVIGGVVGGAAGAFGYGG